MKIVLCTNSFENVVNGPAKFANLILEINKLYPEHEIRVVTEDVTMPHPYVFPVTVKLPSFLNLLSQFFRMFIYQAATKKLRREFEFDVLVYNNSFIGVWSALVSRQPTIGMINDDNNLSTTWSTFKPNQRWFKQYLFKQLEKVSTRFHKKIITNSHFLTEKVISAYQTNPAKVALMYKAVDVSNTPFKADRSFQQPIHLLFVKADFIRGGLDMVAAALRLLPAFPFRLTIIGPADAFKEQILWYFAGLSHTTIDFLGEQPQQVVQQYMQTCDIFCVPSRKEALGVANIEALAYGISTISTNVGGIPEVMDYGQNGWLVNPEDPSQLARALQECIESKSLRIEKAGNGRKFVVKFEKRAMFDRFIEIIQDAYSK